MLCDSEPDLSTIDKFLDDLVNEIKEDYEVVEQFECNRKLYRYLDSKWKKDMTEFKDRLLKCDDKIFDQENEIREVEIENSIKSQLVTKWEQARREQTEGLLREQKNVLLNRIRSTLCSDEREMRIANEVEIFNQAEIERLTQLTKDWQRRFAEESNQLDEEIKSTKLKIERTQDKTQGLREIYIQRNIEIQAYLQQKAAMEEARRLEKLKWDSSVKIQRWWRFTMLRNCLGPFRKKKKQKKGKGGKK